MTEVAQLLEASRQAHTRYRTAAGRINKDGKVAVDNNPVDGTAALAEARSLRRQAHALDKRHVDPAWAADEQAMKGNTHEALLAFYDDYLGRSATRVEKMRGDRQKDRKGAERGR